MPNNEVKTTKNEAKIENATKVQISGEKKVKRLVTAVAITDTKDKTVKVLIDRVAIHPIYKKRIASSKKLLVHTDIDVKKGQIVEIHEVRPVSKNKAWKINKVKE